MLCHAQHGSDRKVSLLSHGCKGTFSYMNKGPPPGEAARACSDKEACLAGLSLVLLCRCRWESCCAAFCPSLPAKRPTSIRGRLRGEKVAECVWSRL